MSNSVAALNNMLVEKINKVVVARVDGRDVTRGELAEAFDRLTFGMENWKLPIETTVRPEEFELMNEACLFFTGSSLTIKLPHKGTRFRVTAPGYFATIGA